MTEAVVVTANGILPELYQTTFDFPPGYILRPLCVEDFDKGYLDLLAQLTTVGPVTRKDFELQFKSMIGTSPRTYHIFVVEHLDSKRIVAQAMLVIELHFIHQCGARGRIEDVVVDQSERGRSFGKLLNQHLVKLAYELGVYKLSLECNDVLMPFYEQFGFKRDGNNFMVLRFNEQ